MTQFQIYITTEQNKLGRFIPSF